MKNIEKTIKIIKLIENDRCLLCALKQSESPQNLVEERNGKRAQIQILLKSPRFGGLGKLPEQLKNLLRIRRTDN